MDEKTTTDELGQRECFVAFVLISAAMWALLLAWMALF